ncbi:MAG: hypothetical protein R2784_14270 [Saprospiraceae bacterium]
MQSHYGLPDVQISVSGIQTNLTVDGTRTNVRGTSTSVMMAVKVFLFRPHFFQAYNWFLGFSGPI